MSVSGLGLGLKRQQVLLTQIVWLCLRPDKAAGKQSHAPAPAPDQCAHVRQICVAKEDEVTQERKAGAGRGGQGQAGSHGKS